MTRSRNNDGQRATADRTPGAPEVPYFSSRYSQAAVLLSTRHSHEDNLLFIVSGSRLQLSG